jgi:hypothetical protein
MGYYHPNPRPFKVLLSITALLIMIAAAVLSRLLN